MWFQLLNRDREEIRVTWDTLGHAFFNAAQRGAETGMSNCGLISRADNLWRNRVQLPLFQAELEQILATPHLVGGAETTVREVLRATREAVALAGYLLIVGE